MAARPTPRYYILHGKDELTRSETLQDLGARLGAPELATLNTTVFDGASVTLAELKNACDTIPFMTQRRMVIVHGLLARLGSPSGSKKGEQKDWKNRYLEELADYVSRLPETTRLIFVEPIQLALNHPILRQAQEDELGYVRAFVPPKDLVSWVRRRAIAKDGRFSPQAAMALVQAASDDQRLLDQEIEKLLAYTNRERPVHNLLDHGNEPLYLLAMIVRQFRLLIQIKELSQEGLDPSAIAKTIKLHPYPTGKLYNQARNFTLEQLERVHHRLLEIDVQIKTGQINEIVALDLLIAGLAPPQ
jgi:DNA polymerase-3 subunit delta